VDYRARIVRDQRICGGEPIIRGTRVTLRTVLASLVEGDSIESILEDFPTLTEEDVCAVIAFAAAQHRCQKSVLGILTVDDIKADGEGNEPETWLKMKKKVRHGA
jgi:uncharacterized protein (DUF433 family)